MWVGRGPGESEYIGGNMSSRPQVSAAEDRAVTKDTDVVLEIPASTTIAYSVIELYVKVNGQFGECPLGALARRLSQC